MNKFEEREKRLEILRRLEKIRIYEEKIKKLREEIKEKVEKIFEENQNERLESFNNKIKLSNYILMINLI